MATMQTCTGSVKRPSALEISRLEGESDAFLRRSDASATLVMLPRRTSAGKHFPCDNRGLVPCNRLTRSSHHPRLARGRVLFGWNRDPDVRTGTLTLRNSILTTRPVTLRALMNDTPLMKDTEHGLTAVAHTPDRSRAERILAQVNAGSAYWNCCDRVSPRLPWSGRKHSGLGTTLSVAGIRTFVQPKAWHLRCGV
jgi:hypothetical protein